MKVDITVVSIASHISVECPSCKEDLEINYSEFCDMAGEPCDWTYSSFKCPNCDQSLEIDSTEWN
jgi:phage FluMu protein Com